MNVVVFKQFAPGLSTFGRKPEFLIQCPAPVLCQPVMTGLPELNKGDGYRGWEYGGNTLVETPWKCPRKVSDAQDFLKRNSVRE